MWTKLAAVLPILSNVVGCSTTTEFETAKHLRPIPPALAAQMQAKAMTLSDPILVRIFKKESELEVWKRDRAGRFALLKTYGICRWSGQLGPKHRDGDRQAPEGFYSVSASMMNPRSQLYLSFDLGFPNALDRAHGSSGKHLMVHGECTSSGCYAMSNDAMAEIYALAREAFAGGQTTFQVQAFPFRMTPENLAKHRMDSNIAFWKNLKEGSDYFEVIGQEPRVDACGRRYVFNASAVRGKIDATRPCPELAFDAERALVAAKEQNDALEVAKLVSAGMRPVKRVYVDGDMHRSFRRFLAEGSVSTYASFDPAAVSRLDAVKEEPIETPLSR